MTAIATRQQRMAERAFRTVLASQQNGQLNKEFAAFAKSSRKQPSYLLKPAPADPLFAPAAFRNTFASATRFRAALENGSSGQNAFAGYLPATT